ncbi:DUF6875 domain-containing protein [Streptomyces sp. NPDC055287]
MPATVSFDDACAGQRAAIETWLSQYISQPHDELGRGGAICPFVVPARRAGVVVVQRASWTPGPHHQRVLADDAPEDTVEAITTVLRMSLERFAAHPWPRTVPALHSLVALLDQLGEEQWRHLDAAHAAVKAEVMRRGFMIGQFHPACPAPAVHNPRFAVNVCPVPLIVVRRISPHDVQFTTEHDHFAAYQEHFGQLHEEGRAPARLARVYQHYAAAGRPPQS